MNLSRRRLLSWGTALGAGASAAFFGLAMARKEELFRFGPLLPDAEGLLSLPAGFSYRVLMRSGQKMSDGRPRRALPDGMASYASAPGEITLLCNHELDDNGGVSRLVLDAETLEVKSSNDVLGGTIRNCSGGPSPWGWLSCEETPGGGVWLCPWDTSSQIPDEQRRRLDHYGSFKHEAICIDPDSYEAYLTEDDGPSHLYRMQPIDKHKDQFVGKLQALCAEFESDFDTADLKVGESFPVLWKKVRPEHARADAQAQGAAIFHRGEGIWFFDGDVFFTATTNDQLFKLTPTAKGGTVRLIANDFDSPDNITVAPWGEVIVAEDQLGRCRLRVVDQKGGVSTLAENSFARGQEFAGVCFSPDGKTLFVNMQKSGHTLAIRGPFV